MHSHFLTLALFAAVVSSVFALVLRKDLRSRLRFGILVFVAFVGSALVAGWLMYPFPR
jgi:hypothetical protein